MKAGGTLKERKKGGQSKRQHLRKAWRPGGSLSVRAWRRIAKNRENSASAKGEEEKVEESNRTNIIAHQQPKMWRNK